MARKTNKAADASAAITDDVESDAESAADPSNEPPRPTPDELVAHAERIAGLINLGHAIEVGLASRWADGLLESEREFMRPRIAHALHEHLAAALRMRGFDATKLDDAKD
jgi:hypothetical protein